MQWAAEPHLAARAAGPQMQWTADPPWVRGPPARRCSGRLNPIGERIRAPSSPAPRILPASREGKASCRNVPLFVHAGLGCGLETCSFRHRTRYCHNLVHGVHQDNKHDHGWIPSVLRPTAHQAHRSPCATPAHNSLKYAGRFYAS